MAHALSPIGTDHMDARCIALSPSNAIYFFHMEAVDAWNPKKLIK
jgi:hypothetical protein